MTAPAPDQPNVGATVPESNLTWEIDFTDEFTGPDGPAENVTNTFKWLDMTESLHKAGNSDIDLNGNSNIGSSADHRRWAAFYGQAPGFPDHTGQVARIENNELLLGGVLTDEIDTGRISYSQQDRQDPGAGIQTVRPDEGRVYTAFGVTSDRVFSNSAGSHIIDPNGPDIFMEPNSAIEFRASFEEMKTRGFRFSVYLLPRLPFEGLAYDESADHVEIDLPEFDPSVGFHGHLQQKVIGGAAGQTPDGSVDVLTDTGIDVSVGYHDHTFLWLDNALVWLVDGVETLRDEILVPKVPHYIVFSREINSGAKRPYGKYDESKTYTAGEYSLFNGTAHKSNTATGGGAFNQAHWDVVTFIDPSEFGEQPHDLIACPPRIPQDVGLYATNWWFDRANVNTDVTRVSYMRTWRLAGTSPPPAPITSVRRLEFAKGIGEGQVEEISLTDPQEGEAYQWTKTVPDTDLEFIGPTDGPSVKVRSSGVSLRTTNNVQLEIDTDAPLNNQIPTIDSPVSIQNAFETFVWNGNGRTVDTWRLQILSSATEFLDTGQITDTQAANTVAFPMDGSSVTATLFFTTAGITSSIVRSFTVPTGNNTTPQITAPAAGSTYNTGPVTFNWVTNGAPETDVFNLKVGNSSNDANFHSSDDLVGVTTYTQDEGMPRDGSQVKITLRWKAAGGSFHSSRSTSIFVTASN